MRCARVYRAAATLSAPCLMKALTPSRASVSAAERGRGGEVEGGGDGGDGGDGGGGAGAAVKPQNAGTDHVSSAVPAMPAARRVHAGGGDGADRAAHAAALPDAEPTFLDDLLAAMGADAPSYPPESIEAAAKGIFLGGAADPDALLGKACSPGLRSRAAPCPVQPRS